MRVFLSLLCLTVGAGSLSAQGQENKLVDRLLRPDMTLANPAQNKQFQGTDATPVEKKFEAKSFYSGKEKTTKRFSGEKDFSANGFQTERFTQAEKAANDDGEPPDAKRKFSTQTSSLARTASENGKVARTRPSADRDRPFLGRGTRQEILSQQDKPLTIDEIRELLNKSR